MMVACFLLSVLKRYVSFPLMVIAAVDDCQSRDFIRGLSVFLVSLKVLHLLFQVQVNKMPSWGLNFPKCSS